MTEIAFPLSFYGNNLKALYCQNAEVILSGPADTGKTLTLLSRLHLLAYKYPGASFVIARKQLTDTFSTVLQTYTKKVLASDSFVKPYGGEKPQWYDYPNGSRVWIAGLDKPGKVLSAEHDIIYINQAEELSLVDWETCTTRTTGRAGHLPFAQTIGDCNPGPPNHWIRTRARDGHIIIIESTHKDNPDIYDQQTGQLTPQGIERLTRLSRLTGSRKLRLFLGLWAAPEGAIYGIFDDEKHKVKHFDPPKVWPRVVGIDPVGAAVVALFVAYDPQNGVLNVYDEYHRPFGISTEEHCKNILEMTRQRGETVFAWVGGGPSERQARLDFESHGIPVLAPPDIGVDAGIDRVISLLEEFRLVIHDNCIGTLSDISDYRRKMGKDGTMTEAIENKEMYHFADALRYIVAWLVEPGQTRQVVYSPLRIEQY